MLIKHIYLSITQAFQSHVAYKLAYVLQKGLGQGKAME